MDYAPDLKRFKEALALKGTALIVLYVPPRPVSAAQYFDLNKPYFKGVDLKAMKASYDEALEAVNAQGVYSPNVLQLQKKMSPGADFFFPRDHHLNLAAMDAISSDLAAYILSSHLLSDDDRASFKLSQGTRLMMGSYNAVTNRICGRLVFPSSYPVVKSEKLEGGLLDDTTPRVVVAGDSNVFRDDGEESLVAYLRHKLQADVLNVGIQGGGPISSLQNYILSRDFQDNPPKVLIWEMESGFELRPFFRQIIPAVHGRCAQPVQTQALVPNLTMAIRPTRLGNSLVYQVSDPAIRALKVSMTTGAGERVTVTLSHTDREAAHPFFYYEPEASLTGLTLLAPTQVKSIQVSECAVPST